LFQAEEINRDEYYYVMTIVENKKQKDSKINKRTVTALGHLQNLIVSSFNALGPLGSVFSAAMSNYLTARRLAHIQGVLDAMANRLVCLPKKNLESILSSDEFLHLCINAMEKAQEEHRESKRKSYGIMLANMACASEFHYDLFNHFLSLLSEMGDLHIALVMVLAKLGVKKNEDKDWVPFKQLVYSCKEVSPIPPSEVVASALQKLAAYGIVKTTGSGAKFMTNTNPVGLWHVSFYSITPTGEKFVEFLKNT
jgi:hypothetical protein